MLDKLAEEKIKDEEQRLCVHQLVLCITLTFSLVPSQQKEKRKKALDKKRAQNDAAANQAAAENPAKISSALVVHFNCAQSTALGVARRRWFFKELNQVVEAADVILEVRSLFLFFVFLCAPYAPAKSGRALDSSGACPLQLGQINAVGSSCARLSCRHRFGVGALSAVCRLALCLG